MEVVWRELTISTTVKEGVIDITNMVEKAVEEMNASEGIVLVFLPHATASIILNEAEEGVMEDVKDALQRLFPRNADYLHNRIDDNGHAHVRGSFLTPFAVLPVKGGRIIRGMWQNIMLVEHDGPRKVRRILLVYLGE